MLQSLLDSVLEGEHLAQVLLRNIWLGGNSRLGIGVHCIFYIWRIVKAGRRSLPAEARSTVLREIGNVVFDSARRVPTLPATSAIFGVRECDTRRIFGNMPGHAMVCWVTCSSPGAAGKNIGKHAP